MRHDSVREGSEAENEPPERVEAARISRDMETIFGATTAGRPAKKSIGSDPVETLVVPRPKRARKPAVGAPTRPDPMGAGGRTPAKHPLRTAAAGRTGAHGARSRPGIDRSCLWLER